MKEVFACRPPGIDSSHLFVRPWAKVQGEIAKMIINWILILQGSQSAGENKTLGQAECAKNQVKSYGNPGVPEI